MYAICSVYLYRYKEVTTAARQSGLTFKVMESAIYKVFWLVGGSANFRCKSLSPRYTWEQAKKEVNELQKAGYKAMAVKQGHIIGGYNDYSDFSTPEKAAEYYRSLE